MDACQLSVNCTGAFWHPLGDNTPIDCRYGEQLQTVELPDRVLLLVTKRTALDFGRIKHPRAVEINNVSNQGEHVQPTEAESAAMARKVLLVGFNDDTRAALYLPPLVPGKTDLGCGQVLWLAPGATVWLDVLPGSSATVRVNIFPGGSDG